VLTCKGGEQLGEALPLELSVGAACLCISFISMDKQFTSGTCSVHVDPAAGR
jgi:hypothetical protein